MKKKQIMALLMTSVMAFSMAACGGSGGSSDGGDSSSGGDSGSSGKSKITFTFRDDGTDLETNALYKWVNAAYESWDKKDEVELDVAPITADEGNYFTKIALQLADPGTCPDLVCEDTFQLPNDAAAGYLTDLTDYVADYADWNDGKYYESMQKMVTMDDKVYGIPYCTDTRGLWYNKSVLEQAGVIAAGEEWQPESWQDILDACKAIKDNCPDVVPFWCNAGKASGEATSMQTYEMIYYGTGARLQDEDGKWITKSPEIEESLQFLSDIFTNGYGPSLSLVLNGQAANTSSREYLPQNKLGIDLDGIWITGSWKENGAAPWDGYEDEVGLAAMPTSEGQDPGTVTLAGGWALSIPENSDNKDLTFEFIQHMMSPEIYLESILNQGNICTRTDTAEEEEYIAQPFFETATKFLETADFRPQNDQYSTVSTSIQAMVESVVSGTSPADAMNQYHTEVARVVGEDNTVQK